MGILMDELNKSYGEILAEVLMDYANAPFKNVDGNYVQVDTSKGSPAYMNATVIAQQSYRVRQRIKWELDQLFVSTACEERLEALGADLGLARQKGEALEDFRSRVLAKRQEMASGGNVAEYVNWAREIEDVATAYSYKLARGVGTVDVVVVADPATGSEIPTQELLDAVMAFYLTVHPSGADIQVLPPVLYPQDIDITMVGGDLAAAAAAITAYLNGMAPQQTLYLDKLRYLCVASGANSVTINTPGGNVSPDDYGMIRPGDVNVH